MFNPPFSNLRLILSGFAVALLACTLTDAAAAPPAKSMEKIVQTEHAWIRASMCGDAAFIRSLLADDYRDLSYSKVGARPEVSDKNASVRSASRRHVAKDCAQRGPHQEGVHVQIHGETAVATGTGVIPARPGRSEVRFHFLDVYAWRDGRWQAVFSEDIGI